jgi:hypothetical protein
LISDLKEQKTSYLVYFTDSVLKYQTTGDIWERTTHFSKRNDQDVAEFDWQWFRHDSLLAHIFIICDKKTMAPICSKAEYRNGIYAFDYRDGKMTGSDTVSNNKARSLPAIPLTIPVISWELDMEMYSLLPVRRIGQVFEIAFFDPSEKQTTYHRYTITGKENLKLNNDTTVPCWTLKINYDEKNYAVFWLTEKMKEVIKMKEYYNGSYRFKIRLF